jgi:hypothetical protein
VTVDVEITRSCDAQDLARALAEQGFEADVLAETGHVVVMANDFTEVEHALDSWVAEKGLPFVLHPVDDGHVVLTPPAS